MKMSKIFSLILVVVMLFSMTSCDAIMDIIGGIINPQPPVVDDELAGTYNIKMWVSEIDGVAELTQQQIAAFEAANPGIDIVAEIEGVSEANAAGQVLNDPATAPDIYCFAQDQLARLVQAAALAPLGNQATANVTANNDAGSVAAATVGGKLYAYPMTSDNGYYLYYDKSVITDPTSLEAIIADCEAAKATAEANDDTDAHYLVRYGLENAWYTASFFFATGCHSTWTMDSNGNYTALDDDFNSEAGLVAMRGMQKLAQSPAYDSNNDIFTNAAAIVTGTWNSENAKNHFGANLGATKLPTFTVEGQTYQLGSFTGNKLMGVKPQTDAKRGAVLQLLAQWLTNEDCQNQRFAQFGWGPSNKNAQATDAVQSDASLAALALQGAHGIPQGQIHGSWWDIAKVLGADAKTASSVADLQASLDTYKATVYGLLAQTEEQKMAWSVIGDMQNSGWGTDFAMEQVSEGKWQTVEPIEFVAGQGFKLRRGAAWDVQVGADGQMKTPEIEPANITAEVTGKYHVVLEWDGTSTTAKVTLVPAN